MDIASYKITNVIIPDDYTPPVFRKTEVKAGEMLCRTGYPLLEDLLATEIRENEIVLNMHPTLFVNSGLVGRIRKESMNDGSCARFIELDSPGLRGQSGGPLFDVDGKICGMQSRTQHYTLGFNTPSPTYYHVGEAIDASTICRYLDTLGIQYSSCIL